MNKTLSLTTLFVLVAVPGNSLAQNPPDWSVNPSDFQFNASMTGVLIFNGQKSTDSEDIIAAFVGDECRGVKTDGIYFPPSEHWVFGLTIYGTTSGEVITFKAYDSSADFIFELTGYTYEFIPNEIIGSAEDPVEWSFLSCVINEIMSDPASVSDADGEWFELYNPSNDTLNLNGWTISDRESDTHTITSNVSIPPLGYAVFGGNADYNTNGGVNIDYEYSGISLANGSDELILMLPTGTGIDSVAWDDGATFPDPAGASMYLIDPDLDNNIGSNWAESSAPYGDGDLGTPGFANQSSSYPPDSFNYISTPSSGLFRGQATIDSIPAEAGDWIAAFDEDSNCAGANILVIDNNISYINLNIYGDDMTSHDIDEGINVGEVFSLHLWDSSHDVIYEFSESFDCWYNNNGAPMTNCGDINTVYDFVEGNDAPELSIDEPVVVPALFSLYQNFPNPFNPITTLYYDLPKNIFVTISIYNILGKQIKVLVNTNKEAGYKSVHWDAKDSMGKPVSAGVYLYQIQVGDFVQTRKMILLK